jgi:colicin import membrane protein
MNKARGRLLCGLIALLSLSEPLRAAQAAPDNADVSVPALDAVSTPDQARAALDETAAARRRLDDRWKRANYDCYQRFAVSRCIASNNAERRKQASQLKVLEIHSRKVIREAQITERNSAEAQQQPADRSSVQTAAEQAVQQRSAREAENRARREESERAQESRQAQAKEVQAQQAERAKQLAQRRAEHEAKLREGKESAKKYRERVQENRLRADQKKVQREQVQREQAQREQAQRDHSQPLEKSK